jgi:hypothetical protein
MTVPDDEPGERAGALLDRYLDGGDPADLATARRLYAAAVAADPEDPYLLNNFGNCLRTCYATGGDPADLAEAARVLTRATELVEPDDPGRATVADNRALVHGDRFAATGDPAELDTALALHRYAVSVDEAIRHYRAAVRATPAGSGDAPLRLANLAKALLERHDRRGQRRDLDAAVEAAEQALRTGSSAAVDRPRQEATLAAALRRRHELDGDPDDLHRAVAGYRWAAEHTPPGAPFAAGWWGNLAVALQRRYDLAGRADDLNAAVEAAENALELAVPGSTGQTQVRTQLGQILVERHRRDGDAATLDRAWSSSSRPSPGHPPSTRPAPGGRRTSASRSWTAGTCPATSPTSIGRPSCSPRPPTRPRTPATSLMRRCT